MGMQEAVQSFDWASTPLGPMLEWPPSLRVAVGICLNSRFPMFVWWGPELINIYNDAYIPVLGKRHGDALGWPARSLWGEIWDVIGPQADAVMQRGEATWNERVLLVMERNGYTENTYFTWSYSPIRDEKGNVGGLFCACTEETQHVLAEAERDRLVAQLETARSRLKEVFLQAPSFIAILRGPKHVFELANAQYFGLIGGREILGKSVNEALPEIADQGFLGLLDRVYTTRETYVGDDVRVLIQRESDQPLEERYLDFVYQPNRDSDGSVIGVICHGVDVTERKVAEKSLGRLAEYRRLALDSAQMGWWQYDLVTGDVRWDDRFKAIFGVHSGSLSYEKLISLIHPEDRDRVDAAVREATRPSDPKPYAIEYRLIHDDGSLHWVVARGQASFEGEGDARRATSFVGTLEDITEARTVENALRESEARFRQLADSMPQIVWTALPDGTLDYYNHRWFEYIDLPDGAIDQATWDRYVHPEDLNRVYFAWQHSIHTRETYKTEFRVRGADQVYRWFLVRAVPVRDGGGSVVRWLGTCTDIHDQKELQAQNELLLDSERAARADAERASRMKDEFLATLSHELRTPLNAILGWSQILLTGGIDPDDLAEGLQTIERNARAQTQIIEDLLDMSRIISGKVRLDVQRLELAPLVQAAVGTMQPAADAKGVSLKAILDPAASPITGDANRLQQVLWNLLSNAIKFTPRGGRVQVLLERVNSHLEVSVIDTGEGIRQDFLAHVFDRFRQADASTTRRHGGLGLGLAIVKQLVELHGGSVRVKSGGQGRGTTFTVSLPLTVIHPDPTPRDGTPPPARRRGDGAARCLRSNQWGESIGSR